jgi:hypothetical protein
MSMSTDVITARQEQTAELSADNLILVRAENKFAELKNEGIHENGSYPLHAD